MYPVHCCHGTGCRRFAGILALLGCGLLLALLGLGLLVFGRRTKRLATAEAAGFGIKAERQADKQGQGYAEKTLRGIAS